jgi:hypothetical protein
MTTCLRLVVAVIAFVSLTATPESAVAATTSKAKVSLASTSVTASATRVVNVKLTCRATSRCKGTAKVRVSGKSTAERRYSIAAKKSRKVSFALTKIQFAAVERAGKVRAKMVITEKKPAKRAARSLTFTLRRHSGVQPPAITPQPTASVPTPSASPTPTSTPTSTPTAEPVDSKAYAERNWAPTSFDTCPASLHRSHSVLGPDGKRYPTWHAPTDTDPATGHTCTYGHEHGDDPATSDIYLWVTDFLNEDATTGRGIPFGYVSEALDTYASEHDHVTRHEDNVGHKIIVANNVKLVASSPRGYVRDASGAIVTCDYLIKVHQGSHSGDAIINNAHELLYAINCTDGTALISSTLTRFGDANEFQRSCDPTTTITTSGSNLPHGFGGARLIPDVFCINRDVLVPHNAQSSVWSLYEVWESANRLATSDDRVLTSFDPWFAVRNPARAHSGGSSNAILDLITTLWLVDSNDDGTAKGYPWDQLRIDLQQSGHSDHLVAKADPLSPFDGAERDYYLKSTTVANAGGPTQWYSDPYGEHAQTSPASGLVRQYVSATDNTWWPELERRQFDLQRDFGHDNGVHAPN